MPLIPNPKEAPRGKRQTGAIGLLGAGLAALVAHGASAWEWAPAVETLAQAGVAGLLAALWHGIPAGGKWWRKALVISGIGAVVSAAVTLIALHFEASDTLRGTLQAVIAAGLAVWRRFAGLPPVTTALVITAGVLAGCASSPRGSTVPPTDFGARCEARLITDASTLELEIDAAVRVAVAELQARLAEAVGQAPPLIEALVAGGAIYGVNVGLCEALGQAAGDLGGGVRLEVELIESMPPLR